MSNRRFTRTIVISSSLIILIALSIFFYRYNQVGNQAAQGNQAELAFSGCGSGVPITPGLPDETKLVLAAQSSELKLWVDPSSAHFMVESKAEGNKWRSYPDPAYWKQETITGAWYNNLLSPAMLEYVDKSTHTVQSKIASWIGDHGVLEGFEITNTGFKASFCFADSQFKIPVQVNIADDYIEVKTDDQRIEEGKLSLLNLKLYPLFGAEPSKTEEGYMLIPDGSGALIQFKNNRIDDKAYYKEGIYGPDAAFFAEDNERNAIKMPVYGMKTGNRAFLAVLTGGAEYANLFAAPAGSFGQSNWITAEWQYRKMYFQNTNKQGTKGYYDYLDEKLISQARSSRYYLLEGTDSDYVGMAKRYREYLMETDGLERLKTKADIPLFLDIIGADTKKGFLSDKYLKLTTTVEASTMLKTLSEQGIKNMTVHYSGWHNGGISSYGSLFPVDTHLGGDNGMRQFIEGAHSLGVSVYLSANYTLNNWKDGFWPSSNGLRNVGGLIQTLRAKDPHERYLTSPDLTVKNVEADLGKYDSLGADGIYYEAGIGQSLNSDYNNRNKANRNDVISMQQHILKVTKDTLGAVQVDNPNFYALSDINHIEHISDDYSYDLITDQAVPFAQIALHGLISYTSEWSNLRSDFQHQLLRNIEYGAYPSYVLADSPTNELKNAYSVWYYSLNYRDWLGTLNNEYLKVNNALHDVQDKFIIGHRSLSTDVKETSYEGGKVIIVNYGNEEFTSGAISVPPQDFIVSRKEIRQ